MFGDAQEGKHTVERKVLRPFWFLNRPKSIAVFGKNLHMPFSPPQSSPPPTCRRYLPHLLYIVSVSNQSPRATFLTQDSPEQILFSALSESNQNNIHFHFKLYDYYLALLTGGHRVRDYVTHSKSLQDNCMYLVLVKLWKCKSFTFTRICLSLSISNSQSDE